MQLAITAFDIPKWTGAISGDWDVNDGPDPTTGIGTVNWQEANSGTPTRYLQFGTSVDSVLFDDTATGTTTINLTTSLSPNSVTVNNSTLAYTFSGAGKLTGATTLLKTGSGTLILVNTGGNDYTGTTTINGGTLQLGDGATFDAQGRSALARSWSAPAGARWPSRLPGPGGGGRISRSRISISGAGAMMQDRAATGRYLERQQQHLRRHGAGGLRHPETGRRQRAGFHRGRHPCQQRGPHWISPALPLPRRSRSTAARSSKSAGRAATASAIALNGGGPFDSVAGTLSLSGNITGTGGLTKIDSGNLSYFPASAVSPLGGFVTNSGTVTFSNAKYVHRRPDHHRRYGDSFGEPGIHRRHNRDARHPATRREQRLPPGGSVGSGDIALNVAPGSTATLNILRGDNRSCISNNITSTGGGTNAITIGATGTGSPSGLVTFQRDEYLHRQCHHQRQRTHHHQ